MRLGNEGAVLGGLAIMDWAEKPLGLVVASGAVNLLPET